MTIQEALQFFTDFAEELKDNGKYVGEHLELDDTADDVLRELEYYFEAWAKSVKQLRAECSTRG